jgi:hypothetical protein
MFVNLRMAYMHAVQDAGGALLDANVLAARYANSSLVQLQPNNGNPRLVVTFDTPAGATIVEEILGQVGLGLVRFALAVALQ